MSKYFLCIALCVFCFFSCKKNTQITTTEVKKSAKNIEVTHKTFSKVDSVSLIKIAQWKEYANFNDFITRFEKISPDEAFDNITELREHTFALEDSLNIPLFKSPSFKSRLHVLKNEVLRLEDMNDIQAITSDEVNAQIDKIFLVYSSLNDKINTVFNQHKFEKDIELDNFFTMDKKELIEKENSKKTKSNKNTKTSKKNSLLKAKK